MEYHEFGNYAGQGFAPSHGSIGAETAGRFGVWPSPEEGIGAIFAKQAELGQATIAQRIASWAPPSENNTKAYVKAIASAMGIDPSTPFSIRDKELGPAFVSAMISVENGSNPYTPQQIQDASRFVDQISPREQARELAMQNARLGPAPPLGAPASDAIANIFNGRQQAPSDLDQQIEMMRAQVGELATRMLAQHPEMAGQITQQMAGAGLNIDGTPLTGGQQQPGAPPAPGVPRPANPIAPPLAMNTLPPSGGIPYTAGGLPSQAESDRRIEDYFETERAKAFSAMPAQPQPSNRIAGAFDAAGAPSQVPPALLAAARRTAANMNPPPQAATGMTVPSFPPPRAATGQTTPSAPPPMAATGLTASSAPPPMAASGITAASQPLPQPATGNTYPSLPPPVAATGNTLPSPTPRPPQPIAPPVMMGGPPSPMMAGAPPLANPALRPPMDLTNSAPPVPPALQSAFPPQASMPASPAERMNAALGPPPVPATGVTMPSPIPPQPASGITQASMPPPMPATGVTAPSPIPPQAASGITSPSLPPPMPATGVTAPSPVLPRPATGVTQPSLPPPMPATGQTSPSIPPPIGATGNTLPSLPPPVAATGVTAPSFIRPSTPPPMPANPWQPGSPLTAPTIPELPGLTPRPVPTMSLPGGMPPPAGSVPPPQAATGQTTPSVPPPSAATGITIPSPLRPTPVSTTAVFQPPNSIDRTLQMGGYQPPPAVTSSGVVPVNPALPPLPSTWNGIPPPAAPQAPQAPSAPPPVTAAPPIPQPRPNPPPSLIPPGMQAPPPVAPSAPPPPSAPPASVAPPVPGQSLFNTIKSYAAPVVSGIKSMGQDAVSSAEKLYTGSGPVERAMIAGQAGPKAYWSAFYSGSYSPADEARASFMASRIFSNPNQTLQNILGGGNNGNNSGNADGGNGGSYPGGGNPPPSTPGYDPSRPVGGAYNPNKLRLAGLYPPY